MINKVNKSIIIFCVFAFGFLLSNLVRSITATLTPVLTLEFDLTAGNLGLLAGGYFIGFSLMQIPVGLLLDKIGPKKVIGYFLIIALIGTISFALAKSFTGLFVSRIFIGVGVSACMMGPLTGYRVWFAEKYQQRANSWMLMVANIGFVSSTLPVQILLPYIGWRWIFILIAILILLSIILIFLFIPNWDQNENTQWRTLKTLKNFQLHHRCVPNHLRFQSKQLNHTISARFLTMKTAQSSQITSIFLQLLNSHHLALFA